MERHSRNVRHHSHGERQADYPNKTRYRQQKQYVDFYYIIQYVILCILFALVCIGIKMVVMNAIHLSPTHEAGNGLINFFEVHNTGAAFNLFAGQSETLVSMAMVAVAIITGTVLFLSAKLTQPMVTAMAFLATGIAMNMVERMQHGYVIDYIQCAFIPNLPVFNFPDLMIVVGAVCLVLSILIQRR